MLNDALVSLGHKESVNCVGFSCDSSMVATGDMNGLIKVWSVETGKEIWSEEATELEVSNLNPSFKC